MRSNQSRNSFAFRPEPVRRTFEMPASISAAVTADKKSSSLRSLNHPAILGPMAGLPGANALRTLVSSSQPVTDRPPAKATGRARSPQREEFPSTERQSSADQADRFVLPPLRGP